MCLIFTFVFIYLIDNSYFIEDTTHGECATARRIMRLKYKNMVKNKQEVIQKKK